MPLLEPAGIFHSMLSSKFSKASSVTRPGLCVSFFGVSVRTPAFTLQQYAHDNNGRFPGDVSQLKPYFKSPIEDAVLQRWAVLPRSKLVKGLQAQLEEDWYITQQAPVNKALDQRILVGLKRVRSFGYGYAPPDFWDIVP